jgi:peptide deformylase
MQESDTEEAVLNLSEGEEIPAPTLPDPESEGDSSDSQPEKISFTTAEGIILPEIEPKVPNIAVFPTHEEVLRTKCAEIPEEVARSEDFRIHVAYMLCGIYNNVQPGVGIASNQVGLPLRVIAIDPEWPVTNEPAPKILLNPVIIRTEGEQRNMEGCLSIPLNYRQEINRARKIVVGAITLDWEPIEFESDGFEAGVIQHEIDHLNGVLFIDRLSRLKRNMYFKKIMKYARRGYKQQKRMKRIERHGRNNLRNPR